MHRRQVDPDACPTVGVVTAGGIAVHRARHANATCAPDRACTERFAVELLGAPGTGKTTLARALAAQLAQQGVTVRLVVSARPEEGADGPTALPVSRTAKVFHAFSQLSQANPVADALLARMPVSNPLVALRRRRYLADLAETGSARGLLVQDQGYLCAIAGLALDSGRSDAKILDQALDFVPLPRIAVRISVPQAVAAARLEQRLARQGFARRLLERRPADNPLLEDVFDGITTALGTRDCRVLRVSGADHSALCDAVSRISQAVLSAVSAAPQKAALS